MFKYFYIFKHIRWGWILMWGGPALVLARKCLHMSLLWARRGTFFNTVKKHLCYCAGLVIVKVTFSFCPSAPSKQDRPSWPFKPAFPFGFPLPPTVKLELDDIVTVEDGEHWLQTQRPQIITGSGFRCYRLC
nr:hypothetical protein [Mucilaginibacter sp. X5P1]